MPPSTSGTEEITFQLTDAQFSVIALAAPGKPSVVIDRIAYTPYGEPTRRLRSDVDGNGVVDSRDYEDVIQQLIGTPITSPTYRVEADLDRNGAITLADYDICIADDGRKILGGGGVGETDLFSPGVRN
ncbi:MAG: dockerin type I domain-containing protein, partial [bacterium]